jgi:hypothetical protein
MAKTKSHDTKTKKTQKSKDVFDSGTPADALAILKTLSREDTHLREKIESMVIELLEPFIRDQERFKKIEFSDFSELDRITHLMLRFAILASVLIGFRTVNQP